MPEIGKERLLDGPLPIWERSVAAWAGQPVDLELPDPEAIPYPAAAHTIAEPVSVHGPGTFFRGATRTVTFEPLDRDGWWMDRQDLPESLSTRVSVRNVWTTGAIISNIVLRSGAPGNYVRMVEHIVALKLGLGLDRIMIRLDSGDPPLFDRGSLDLVEALDRAGRRALNRPARWVTVTEPVAVCSPSGAFLVVHPCTGPEPRLRLDAAIDFPNAIGRQRIRFTLDEARFRHGAFARTNTSAAKKLYCRTVGRVFADIRNLGYTGENLLIAGRSAYVNEPRLLHEGRSLEAVWHRTALDLLAALALVEEGRLVGDVISYKAGHALDVKCITLLYREGLLAPFRPSAQRVKEKPGEDRREGVQK